LRACASEEIFWPFATLLGFDTTNEAIAIANSSRFGLAGYVWPEDLATAMCRSREIRAGTIWVSTPMIRELRGPFGAYMQSGVGRDGPASSVDFHAVLKSTIL